MPGFSAGFPFPSRIRGLALAGVTALLTACGGGSPETAGGAFVATAANVGDAPVDQFIVQPARVEIA